MDGEYAADCLIAFRDGGSEFDELGQEVGALLIADGIRSLRMVRLFLESMAKQARKKGA